MITQLFEKYKMGGGSAGQIARDVNVSTSYVSQAVNGWANATKPSDEAKRAVESKILNYLISKDAFKGSLNDVSSAYKDVCDDAGILEFSNTINIIKTVLKTTKQRAITKICAKSGSGKTTAVKAIMKKLPQMVYVCYEGISAKGFLEELAVAIGVKNLPKTTQELMRTIKKELSSNKKIIAIDEANFLRSVSLEHIRHIHDVCDIPFILIGTGELDQTIACAHEQISSRIRESLPLVSTSEIEVEMLAKSFNINLSETQTKKLWKKCKNLREVKYWCEDFVERYDGDVSYFEESLA